MSRPRQVWSEERLSLLRDLVHQGLTRSAMAAALHTSKFAIDRQMAHEGLRSSVTSKPPAASPSAFPDRLPQGCKVTLPPLPSLKD